MRKYLILIFVLALSLSGTASAGILWGNGAGDWNDAANWLGGVVPGSDDDVALVREVWLPPIHVTITADAECDGLWISNSSKSISGLGSLPVILTVDGGNLTTGSTLRIASEPGDYGILQLLGSSINVNGGGSSLEIGFDGIGAFYMTGGDLLAKDLKVGAGDGQGFATITGGEVELKDDLEVACQEDSTGTLYMLGGTIDLSGGDDFKIAEKAGDTGFVVMSGDSFIDVKDDVKGAHEDSTSTATLEMSGDATIECDDLEFAKNGTGSIVMSGNAKIIVDDDIKFAENESGIFSLVMTGSTTFSGRDDMVVGKHGVATIDISGTALIDLTKDDLELGQKAGGDASMIMSGDSIVNIADSLEFSKSEPGDAGVSSLVMSGGTITIGKHMKMAQCGGQTEVVMTGGLIYVGEELNVPHTEFSKDMTGTVAHLTLGDADPENGEGALGDATIDAFELSMENAYTDDVDAWIDFLPGGLLLLRDGDVTDDIEVLIADGKILTTYNYGDGAVWFDTLWGSLGTPHVITEFVGKGVTRVYLIPEPATIALLGFGGLALIRRKRS